MTTNKKVGCMFGYLPEDIIVSSILPCLTMHEVARTSVVSRAWNHYWHRIPHLNFHNPVGLECLNNQSSYYNLLDQIRFDFVSWVDGILHKHVGHFIHEFKLTFFLDNDHHCHINKWFVWALLRNVKRLHLDLNPLKYSGIYIHEHHICVLDKPINVKVKPALTSLCLKSVNVSNEFVEFFLDSCGRTLENLLIDNSDQLKCIKGSNACVSLKYFKVSNCRDLVTIDIIDAPSLESFVYKAGHDPDSGLDSLRIGNASSLSHVWIQVLKEDRLLVAFQSLSKYFPHLKCLKLEWFMETKIQRVLHDFPSLANLKHLELIVHTLQTKSIVAWIPFLKACPLLEKLTFGLRITMRVDPPTNVKFKKHPLLYLKTLEIMDFKGSNIDIDFVNFVFENGVALQQVILRASKHSNSLNLAAPLDALGIEIPRGVKLVLDLY